MAAVAADLMAEDTPLPFTAHSSSTADVAKKRIASAESEASSARKRRRLYLSSQRTSNTGGHPSNRVEIETLLDEALMGVDAPPVPTTSSSTGSTPFLLLPDSLLLSDEDRPSGKNNKVSEDEASTTTSADTSSVEEPCWSAEEASFALGLSKSPVAIGRSKAGSAKNIAKKPQKKYDPDIPMSRDEAAAWRREQRKKRNRESAAASRQRQRDRIEELELEIQEWKARYAGILAQVIELEGQGGEGNLRPTAPMQCIPKVVTPRAFPTSASSIGASQKESDKEIRGNKDHHETDGGIVEEMQEVKQEGVLEEMLPTKMISRPAAS
jgi:hypothetical protein